MSNACIFNRSWASQSQTESCFSASRVNDSSSNSCLLCPKIILEVMPQVRYARCSLPSVHPGVTEPHQPASFQQNPSDSCTDIPTQMGISMLWLPAAAKILKATALNCALRSCLLWMVLINQQQVEVVSTSQNAATPVGDCLWCLFSHWPAEGRAMEGGSGFQPFAPPLYTTLTPGRLYYFPTCLSHVSRKQ